MVLHTPLLRVSRPVAACSRCRSAKVKCDGKLPACTACEKANKAAECSSTNDQFAKGKERSYVATLETKVENLERKLLETQARRKSSIAMMDAGFITPRRISVDRRPNDRRAARRKEASDIDDLVSDFGFLAVSATARDFYGFTSTMSYAKLILSASTKEPLATGITKVLPPRHEASPLIERALTTMLALLPIVEPASLYTSLAALYPEGGCKPTAFDNWLVRMILAIASLARSESRGDGSYLDAIGHVSAALEFSEQVLHPGSVQSIQALILLVVYATLDPHHFDSWTLIGAASRAMVDLGIHQDPSKSANMPKAKLEFRRRVFYCVYALDRSTSLVQTRAFSFSDDSAHVALPFSGEITTPKQGSGKARTWLQAPETALDLFRLRQIQSRWYTTLFQSGRAPWQDPYPKIWEIYQEMTTWYANLSKTLAQPNQDYFELELLYSYVYILSPGPRCPRISDHAQRLIFEHCIAYANKITQLTTNNTAFRPMLTFYDAMRVYMTGRQFVDVLSRNLATLLDGGSQSSNTPTIKMDSEPDPLAKVEIQPPPIPSAPQATSSDPITRAVNAINDFTAILSSLGNRFGYISWRDRFQRESAPLLAQLFRRSQGQVQAQQQQAQQQQQQQRMDTPFAGWNMTQSTFPQVSPSHPAFAANTGYVGGQRDQSNGAAFTDYSFPQATSGATSGDMDPATLMAWETLPGGFLNARFN
ncbi:hypothetical protein K402DRAFT_323885 [Aulographum hederae CBS 113979]|uniref:Zn(2)-C6 fungal-type domain-containing protein n=1 Tax=Aulographum hederae CBS 113979 TaxID=1176131 RepID=A0A6G1HCU1_9PEZI|nr:hypothetical protein K402DRAFT_323885 [Aulographum hederae CBS 113979]